MSCVSGAKRDARRGRRWTVLVCLAVLDLPWLAWGQVAPVQPKKPGPATKRSAQVPPRAPAKDSQTKPQAKTNAKEVADLVSAFEGSDNQAFFMAYNALEQKLAESGAASEEIARQFLAQREKFVSDSDALVLLDAAAKKKASSAGQLLLQIARARRLLHTYQRGHVVVGQVIVEDGKLDADLVLAQMPIMADGYFAGEVADLDRPISFCAQGYKGIDVPLKGKKGQVVSVGKVRIMPLPKEERASLRGTIELDEGTPTDAKVQINLQVGPVNTPHNGYAPRGRWPAPITAVVNEKGAFAAEGLSPGEYIAEVVAEKHADMTRRMSLKSGESADLGVCRLLSTDVGHYVGKPAPDSNELAWEKDFTTAAERAKREKKPLMVMMTAAWCGYCKMLENQTFSDAWVRYFLSPFVVVKAYEDKQVEAKYGANGYPTLVFTDSEGNAAYKSVGFKTALPFCAECAQAIDALRLEMPGELRTLIEKKVIALKPSVPPVVMPEVPAGIQERGVSPSDLGAKRMAAGYAASWSPDGKSMLVSARNDKGIDRVDVKTGQTVKLLDAGKDPAFSPSGETIAYVRNNSPNEEVWFCDADGSNARKLADGHLPRWSGDGKQLYFCLGSERMIKCVDMTTAKKVVRDFAPCVESYYPVVSPDGTNVAFVAGGQLVVVNLATKKRVSSSLPGGGAGLVGWSPDGNQVAYGSYGVSDNVGLWLYDLASAKTKRILSGQYTMPVWSPDGKWLAFDLRPAGLWEVWAMEAEKLEKLDALAAPADRYAVPDGGVDKLLAFIKELRGFHPANAQELLEHRAKAPAAIAAAAEKILAQETDKTSAAYSTAQLAALEPQVAKLLTLAAPERETIIDELQIALANKAKHGLEAADVTLIATAARTLEYGDNPQLAARQINRFAETIGRNGEFAAQARSFEGTARRLGLVGHELTLTGNTAAGEPFDWAAYRDKIVLIDFWATWCGPCVAELPNVRALYDQYHPRGFDVVGISLDRDRAALDKFLAEKAIPWTTLHQADGQHPAAEHYGISAIPTMFLVGRDGKVVSIRARGDELKRLLGELIGPGAP